MKIVVGVMALVAAVSATAVTAAGATIAPGDVATGNGYCFFECGPFWTNLLSPSLAPKGELKSNGAIAFGPGNRLYVAAGPSGGIDVYDAGAAETHINLMPLAAWPAGIAVAANGDFIVLDCFDGSVHVYAPNGVQKRAYTLADAAIGCEASLDLAPNQCTIFYTSGNGVRRFDTCTGQPLADVPGTTYPAAARTLSDGGYVVARKGTLSVYDAGDHVVRTVPAALDWPVAICFDADARYVWVSDTAGITKVQLSNGFREMTGPRDLRVAVNGERRPSTSEAVATTDVPALSPSLLVAVALGLIALAWQRLRA